MVLNGFSLTVWKHVAVTSLSSSFEWGEGRGGRGRTSAKVGSSAKFEFTCHFMLCFTGLFILHTKDLIIGIHRHKDLISNSLIII